MVDMLLLTNSSFLQAYLLVLGLAVGVSSLVPTVVETEYGKVEGEMIPNSDVLAFYHIPYATPPVDALRLRPPQPPSPWNNTLDCTHMNESLICVQFEIDKAVKGQENCLFLNIFVPQVADIEEPIPVMFWVHGGGFVVGNDFLDGSFNGQNLSSTHKVIVVEANYRLGPLGFLALPELLTESGTTGNYGILDQQLAMKFVQSNIAKFGGDPKRVAIFGQSAGGMSICWHVANPSSAGLFSAAMMESGSCSSREFFLSLDRAYDFGEEFLVESSCDNSTDVPSCLRGLSVNNFTVKWNSSEPSPPLAPFAPWGAAIDGTVLTMRPLDAITSGSFNRVPFLMGSNLDEGSMFEPMLYFIVPDLKFPILEPGFQQVLLHIFNETTAAEISAFYPLKDYEWRYVKRIEAILRDYFFLCPTRQAARAVTSHGVGAYLYQFTHKIPQWSLYTLFGDYHSVEIPYVFNNQKSYTFDESDLLVSDAMTLYWSNMARYGDPNHDLGIHPTWPLYSADTDQNLKIEIPLSIVNHLEESFCDFWETRYPYYN